MAENNKKGLTLNHLFWAVIVIAVSMGIAWGALGNQQRTNTAEIKEKVSKEVFNMHNEQQIMQYADIKESLKRIEEK